jgi:nucleoid-associated protein YgaU
MELKRLTILVESSDQPFTFGTETSDTTIVAMFNPNKLGITRQVNWGNQQAARRDNPEAQYTGAEPAMLSIDLLFDTYDSPADEEHKVNVKTKYVNKLLRLTTVEGSGGLHRPPICRLVWGSQGVFFQGYLQQLDTQYTLFTSQGVPVRATNRCSFKQWCANVSDLKQQNLMSADIAKVWVVKQGQTLASIAAAEFGDPRAWIDIARANAIDDPLRLPPGTRLLLPARKPGAARRLP